MVFIIVCSSSFHVLCGLHHFFPSSADRQYLVLFSFKKPIFVLYCLAPCIITFVALHCVFESAVQANLEFTM